MIETQQSVTIAAPIGAVWDYAQDVERWAEIMPGYQTCTIIDPDHSRWVLKVGVGGLVRTVKVEVHVERWAGPGEVDFTFRLDGDPVSGSGSYRAAPLSPHETSVALAVQVSGSGPMAPMWEAMGGPLLPKFAAGFAGQLKARIEAAAAPAGAIAPPQPAPGLWARLIAWLRRIFAGRP